MKKTLILLLAFLLPSLLFAEEKSSKGMEVISKANRYALLIGVNTYNAPIRSLHYCKTDMRVLSECFQKIGFPKENIFLMTDDSEGVYMPTGGNIRRQIESVTSLMTEEDFLFVAFSGHGAEVNGEAYLCPSDTSLNSVSSLVSRDWAFAELDKCKASQKIFLVDACRNEVVGGGGKSLSGARTLEDPTGAKAHGFILLASCDQKQQSWEDTAIGQGVFTYYFTKGLSGAAKDEEGNVSLLNLFSYTSRKTKMHVFRTFNMVQVPTLKQGGEMTDILLAKMPSRTAGERLVKTVDGIEYAFRWCPAGTFQMGSPSTEEGRDSDETQHTVTLTKGFWMMETEVTQGMWQSIMGTTISQQRDKADASKLYGVGSDYPMYYVNWEESQEFCRRLSSKLGVNITLPTEAQWEYACRAGTKTSLYNGEIRILGANNAPLLDAIAWYGGNSSVNYRGSEGVDSSGWSEKQYSGSLSGAHPVKGKTENAWGLYDMIGNVCEWCSDGRASYPSGSVTDPTGDSSASSRVYRGGGWFDDARHCRSAGRDGVAPDNRDGGLGLRCSFSPDR